MKKPSLIFLTILITAALIIGIGVNMNNADSPDSLPPENFSRNTPTQQNPPAREEHQKSNRLINEKSPYLLQHAYNPVDWHPWSQAAFEKAQLQNKPIFLSIGYSTCHWCHVMERESFEDPEVAALMNQAFISIKVDREERPDIDNIYMKVCQLTTGSGGWPLTIIMTPDKKPFFAATYIPKTTRLGRLGMIQLIPRVQQLWTTQQDKLLENAQTVLAALQQNNSLATATAPSISNPFDKSVLDTAYRQLTDNFDANFGGFGSAPKFPTPHNLLLLLRHHRRHPDSQALTMVETTLTAMRNGGIYDHVGFGFHRYSTDHKWLVPHFEKMLYDQALLALAYLETYQLTGKNEHAQTAREIFTYVLRDLTSPQGGFYSAEDADSEGVEGKFYLWTKQQINTALPKNQAELIIKAFNVSKKGNFIEETGDHETNNNILHLQNNLSDLAAKLNTDPESLQKQLESARKTLFDLRKNRIHPYKDDKILTDWNGLMIVALARGAQLLNEPAYANAAARAVDFIYQNLHTPDGRLLHRFRNNHAALPPSVDDYAFLTWALLELYEATFDIDYLKKALNLQQSLNQHFWNDAAGGFFFTPDDGEKLLIRQIEIYDGAVPSGNSVALLNLLKLARITGNLEFENQAATMYRLFSPQVQTAPIAHSQMLLAVDFAVGPAYEVVIAGRSDAPDTTKMINTLRKKYLPNKVLLFRPTEQNNPPLAQLAPFTANQLALNNTATAYVCLNQNCQLPTTDINKMLQLLKSTD